MENDDLKEVNTEESVVNNEADLEDINEYNDNDNIQRETLLNGEPITTGAKESYNDKKLFLCRFKDAVMNKFVNTIRMPYYYIPPCPKCGNEVTGRLVKAHSQNDMLYIIEDSLKSGEIIRAVDEVNTNNCFCYECDYQWYSNTSMKWYTLREIEKEKIKRHIPEFIESWNEKRAEAGIQKPKGLTGMFINFVGRI